MAIADSNGIVSIQNSDLVSPLPALINQIPASVSSALNLNLRTFLVTNATARNTLATQRVPSLANPLLVWRQDTGRFELNEGSGWQNWPQSDIVLPGPNDIVINGTTYQRTGNLHLTGVTMTSKSGGGYKGSKSFSRPYNPPAGWRFNYNVQYATTSDVMMMFGGIKDSESATPTVAVWSPTSSSSRNIPLVWSLYKHT